MKCRTVFSSWKMHFSFLSWHTLLPSPEIRTAPRVHPPVVCTHPIHQRLNTTPLFLPPSLVLPLRMTLELHSIRRQDTSVSLRHPFGQ